jgi:hypothetical protein
MSNQKRFIPILETEFDVIVSANDAKMMLVFLAIKKHFRWKTRNNSYPSYDTIALESGLSRRTVIRKCERLKRIGVLDWESRATKHQSNIYSFPLEDGAKLVALPTTRDIVSPETEMVSGWTNDGAKSGPKSPKDGVKLVAHELDNSLLTKLSNETLTRSDDNTDSEYIESQKRPLNNSKSKEPTSLICNTDIDREIVRYWENIGLPFNDDVSDKTMANYPSEEIILLKACFDTLGEIKEYMDWFNNRNFNPTWKELIETDCIMAWQVHKGYCAV